MHVIIAYAETFEYYIKKRGGGVNINKNLIYYSVKDVWEIKIETPGKNVLKHSDWKEQNKTQRSKKGNK